MESLRAKTVLVLLVIMILLMIVTAIVWRDHLRSRPPSFLKPTTHERETINQAYETYSSLRFTPINELRSEFGLDSVFDSTPVLHPLDPVQHHETIDSREVKFAASKLQPLMSDLLELRILNDDSSSFDDRFNRYLRWRNERGDKLASSDDPESYLYFIYTDIVEGTPTPGASRREIFESISRISEQQLKDFNTPIAIATGAEAQMFEMWWHHPHTGPKTPQIRHPLGRDGWIENFASGSFSWFEHSARSPDLQYGMDLQLHAYAGVMIEYANGDRRPLALKLRWEPIDQEWEIELVIHANTNREQFQMVIY
jgi:hypothetical protein